MLDAKPFHLLEGDHLLALGLIAALGTMIVWTGRRSGPGPIRWLGRLLAFGLLSYVVTVYLQKGLAGELNWESALPLELCHWVMFACVIALVRPSPLASEITYFMGLTGTLQATLTPDISRGFPSWEFILYFWSHGTVLLTVTYLIACRRLQPRRGSLLRMMLFVNLYALLVGSIDAFFGWNYGYLRSKPGTPSILDYLGPWPWYLLSLEFMALVNFLLLALPWRMVHPQKPLPGQEGTRSLT